MHSQARPSAATVVERAAQSGKEALSHRIRSQEVVMSGPEAKQAPARSHTTPTATAGGNHSAAHAISQGSKAAPISRLMSLTTTASTSTTISGKLYQLIEFLKKVECSLTAEEIREQLRLDIFADRQFYETILKNPKIHYADGKYSYMPTYNIRNKEDLLHLVREHWLNGQGGVHVRDLKDTWKGVGKAIEELAESHLVSIIRSKDEKPLVIFYNELPDFSSKPFEEFQDLWRRFTIPDDADLQRALETGK